MRTLANAFATGRIAQAYMLTGVRGVGKTTTARLIARALNYPGGPVDRHAGNDARLRGHPRIAPYRRDRDGCRLQYRRR